MRVEARVATGRKLALGQERGQALGLLDHSPQHVERGDVARLTGIPGVGKKTAERIVLELKNRLPRVQAAAAAGAASVTPEPSALRDDVLSALVNLGYHRPLAERAVDAAVKTAGRDAGFERTLKQALRELAK